MVKKVSLLVIFVTVFIFLLTGCTETKTSWLTEYKTVTTTKPSAVTQIIESATTTRTITKTVGGEQSSTVTIPAKTITITVTRTINTTSTPPTTTSNPPTTSIAPKTTATNYSIGQNVVIGTTAKWIVNDAEDKGDLLPLTDSRYYPSSVAEEKTTTGKFIKVTFIVENLSSKTITWPDKPVLVDNQNREYDACSDCWEWIPETLHWSSPDLQPNFPKQFILIFEIPSSAIGLCLKVNDLTDNWFVSPETVLISLGF